MTSMNAQHTPGPWQAMKGERNLHKVGATTPRGLLKSIAQVGGYGGDSREANARLIAAAPELLEALVDLLKHNTPGDRERAILAIKKATGEQS